MIKLKKNIVKIDSLPSDSKKNTPLKIIFFLFILFTIAIISYIIYNKTISLTKTIDINDIKGKKIYLTDCNTKDYLIIGKDKSFSLNITDNNCNTNYYEGNIIIKKNIIYFTNGIEGTIVDNYNIIINGNIFKDE